VIDFHLLL